MIKEPTVAELKEELDRLRGILMLNGIAFDSSITIMDIYRRMLGEADVAVEKEKAMRDAGRVQVLRGQPLHGGNPATSLMAGGTKASALNSFPI